MYGHLAIAAFALIGTSTPLWADSEAPFVQGFSLGVLAHDVDNLWSGFRRERGVDLNAEVAFRPLYSFDNNVSLYPAAGVSLNSRGDTSKVYGGLRLEYLHDLGFFANIGLGGALHDGELETSRRDRKNLGSRFLFHIPFEVGVEIEHQHRVSVYFDHVSNADLADANEGLDTLGLRYGYRY